MQRTDASEVLDALAPALQLAANNIVRHAYGPDGLPWGTPFADVEDLAVQVGNLLARTVLQTALHGQAAQPRPDHLATCPSCAGPLEPRPDAPREIHARPGAVAWDEPATYCPRCRRAFFPSVPEPRP